MKIPILVASSANASNNSLTLKGAIALIIVTALSYSGIAVNYGEVAEMVNTAAVIISAIAFVYGGVRRIINARK